MWGRVGALCLSSCGCDSLGFRQAAWSHPHEDKHKAPTRPHIRPLSLQDGNVHCCIRLAKFIRAEARIIPDFGYQTSLSPPYTTRVYFALHPGTHARKRRSYYRGRNVSRYGRGNGRGGCRIGHRRRRRPGRARPLPPGSLFRSGG
jgi:hypothetical protein